MICHSSLLVSKPFSGLPVFREIIANMGTGSRFGFRTGLLFSLLLSFSLFGQTSGDPIGAVSDALRAGEFAKALQLVQIALQRAPTSAQLWTLQGLAYSGGGHKKDALGSFRAALRLSPDYLPALEGAAQIEYDEGSAVAVQHLARILRLRPSDATSHAMLAVLDYKLGDCTGAVQHFQQSGSLASSQPAALQEHGACLVKLRQFDKAVAVFRILMEQNPAEAHARYQLAAVQLIAERPKDTIDTLTPLLQSNHPESRILQLASSAYEAAGDTPNAVRTLRQAIVTDPRNVDLYLDFANLSMDHQSFDVGVDVINSGLKLQPGAAALYVARGILDVQLAKFDEAEADFEKANVLDPAGSLGSVAQGLEAVQSNDPDRALTTVRAKLAKEPDDPYLLYLQAEVLTQKGVDPGTPGFAAALRSAKRAVALQPSLSAARDVLAKLYLQSGQNQLAIEQCHKALDTDPKDQTALYHLIQALRKTGVKNEIPELLKRLAELRAGSTKQESEHNRYKLVEENGAARSSAQP
jgi:tetratricopeptide (TPR) repeat protein